MESLSDLDKKLWTHFSRFIRLRDTDGQGYGYCISCSRRIQMRSGQCGHYIPRTYQGTKYEELNNHLQCPYCNEHLSGNPEKYRSALETRYGSKIFPYLEEKKSSNPILDRLELLEMTAHYKACNLLMEKIKSRGGSVPPIFFKMADHPPVPLLPKT